VVVEDNQCNAAFALQRDDKEAAIGRCRRLGSLPLGALDLDDSRRARCRRGSGRRL
jgi:hypothetical protein